ncbi:hypothetical protein RAB80_002120 [Fusarium oxysporum f. sp. vasinfectum]|nr:hypothetical protein RAB80_002120 [Fusarium oxysporum f. sp. vasinfectum]KAK2936788.1 hypothetical protein FoTM2_000003 [Fusarium oxysporum f. sp. vasinfectum]
MVSYCSVAITDEKDKEAQPQFNALNTKPIFAHPMYPVDDEKRIQSKLKLAITAPPVNKTEFGRTSGEKSGWELRAIISSVPKALWDRYDPSKDPSKNSRSLLDPSGPATVDLMMGVQLIPPEAHLSYDRIKPFDSVKSQLEDAIKPINFPDTTKFQNDAWTPALPVKPTPDNPAKPWEAVRDLWLKPKDGEGSAKKAVELWMTAMNWTVGDLTGIVPERTAKDFASLYVVAPLIAQGSTVSPYPRISLGAPLLDAAREESTMQI